jgi:hypothetical protein
MSKDFKSFSEFYPFYLTEHVNKKNRVLHFIGTSILILIFIYALISGQYKLLWLCPLIGYGFAWAGHMIFEKNRPATFKNPFYSLASDFVMWWQLLTRKIYF